MMARKHMMQTWTSSFLQTSREFFSVRRLGSVLDRVTKVELWTLRDIRYNSSDEFTCVGPSHHFVLPDWVSCWARNRWGRGWEAAVTLEILYGATPGRVNGSHLTASVWLLSIKPEQNVLHQTLSIHLSSHPFLGCGSNGSRRGTQISLFPVAVSRSSRSVPRWF